jgi:hypothetical protein
MMLRVVSVRRLTTHHKKGEAGRVRAGASWAQAWFSFLPNSKFFHSLSITSIFERMHEALNADKK